MKTYYSIREAAEKLRGEKLNVTEAFVSAYVFGEGVKRYRSKLQPRSHLIDDDGLQFVRGKAIDAERNRVSMPLEVAC